MIDDALLGFGLAAIFDGLALALAPGRIEEMLAIVRSLGPDRLRMVGLAAVALGVALVAVARG